MFFPDSDWATNSQRVRPPDAAPVLMRRLSCTYMVSLGFGRSVTHPMGAHEAAALRRVAAEVSRHDPAFAADLFAAADRHIGSNDGQ